MCWCAELGIRTVSLVLSGFLGRDELLFKGFPKTLDNASTYRVLWEVVLSSG